MQHIVYGSLNFFTGGTHQNFQKEMQKYKIKKNKLQHVQAIQNITLNQSQLYQKIQQQRQAKLNLLQQQNKILEKSRHAKQAQTNAKLILNIQNQKIQYQAKMFQLVKTRSQFQEKLKNNTYQKQSEISNLKKQIQNIDLKIKKCEQKTPGYKRYIALAAVTTAATVAGYAVDALGGCGVGTVVATAGTGSVNGYCGAKMRQNSLKRQQKKELVKKKQQKNGGQMKKLEEKYEKEKDQLRKKTFDIDNNKENIKQLIGELTFQHTKIQNKLKICFNNLGCDQIPTQKAHIHISQIKKTLNNNLSELRNQKTVNQKNLKQYFLKNNQFDNKKQNENKQIDRFNKIEQNINKQIQQKQRLFKEVSELQKFINDKSKKDKLFQLKIPDDLKIQFFYHFQMSGLAALFAKQFIKYWILPKPKQPQQVDQAQVQRDFQQQPHQIVQPQRYFQQQPQQIAQQQRVQQQQPQQIVQKQGVQQCQNQQQKRLFVLLCQNQQQKRQLAQQQSKGNTVKAEFILKQLRLHKSKNSQLQQKWIQFLLHLNTEYQFFSLLLTSQHKKQQINENNSQKQQNDNKMSQNNNMTGQSNNKIEQSNNKIGLSSNFLQKKEQQQQFIIKEQMQIFIQKCLTPYFLEIGEQISLPNHNLSYVKYQNIQKTNSSKDIDQYSNKSAQNQSQKSVSSSLKPKSQPPSLSQFTTAQFTQSSSNKNRDNSSSIFSHCFKILEICQKDQQNKYTNFMNVLRWLMHNKKCYGEKKRSDRGFFDLFEAYNQKQFQNSFCLKLKHEGTIQEKNPALQQLRKYIYRGQLFSKFKTYLKPPKASKRREAQKVQQSSIFKMLRKICYPEADIDSLWIDTSIFSISQMWLIIKTLKQADNLNSESISAIQQFAINRIDWDQLQTKLIYKVPVSDLFVELLLNCPQEIACLQQIQLLRLLSKIRNKISNYGSQIRKNVLSMNNVFKTNTNIYQFVVQNTIKQIKCEGLSQKPLINSPPERQRYQEIYEAQFLNALYQKWNVLAKEKQRQTKHNVRVDSFFQLANKIKQNGLFNDDDMNVVKWLELFE